MGAHAFERARLCTVMCARLINVVRPRVKFWTLVEDVGNLEKLKVLHTELMSDICARPGLSADSIRKIPAQLTQSVELYYELAYVKKYVEKFPCLELPAHGDLVQLASNVPWMVLDYAKKNASSLVPEEKKLEAIKSAAAIGLLYERELGESIEEWQHVLAAEGHDWLTIATCVGKKYLGKTTCMCERSPP